MDARKSLLAQLDGTSLDNLQEILDAICLQEAATTATADNDEDEQDNEEVNAPQDDPKAQQDVTHNAVNQHHLGIFAQAYAQRTLAAAHADLYANFDAVGSSKVHNYMQCLGYLDATQCRSLLCA